MAGEYRDQADDNSYRVTIGSVDNPKFPDDTYFITQQDNQGNHMASIFDPNDNILDQSYKGKGV